MSPGKPGVTSFVVPYDPAMELPLSVKGFTAMRVGAGLVAVAAPSVLARFFGLSSTEARTPFATSISTFFGVRELVLAALTVGAAGSEPRARRRLLVANAATDGLDVVVLGVKAIRQPALRRGLVLFGPGAALSVVLHLRAAQRVEVGP